MCQDFTCKAPTQEPAQLRALLEETRTYGGASWGVAASTADLSKLKDAARAQQQCRPEDACTKDEKKPEQ